MSYLEFCAVKQLELDEQNQKGANQNRPDPHLILDERKQKKSTLKCALL